MADKASKYPFSTSAAESTRLHSQHHIWRAALGYSIHPSISLPQGNASIAIADVASGTGAWLLDVAQELSPNPVLQLTGLDISLAQCPPKAWLPKSMDFRTWDVFSEVPKGLAATFDLVHVRLLLCVVKDEQDVKRVIRNLRALLKPGGYLQWDEENSNEQKVHLASPEMEAPNLERLRTYRISKGRFDWLFKMPSLLESAGFENATVNTHWSSMAMARAESDTTLVSMEHFVSNSTKKYEQRLGSMNGMLEAAYQESIAGAALCTAKTVYVARKLS